jgi:hypothetical protein
VTPNGACARGHGFTIVWGMASDRIANGWGGIRGQNCIYITLNHGEYIEDKHQLNPVFPILVIYRSRTNKGPPAPFSLLSSLALDSYIYNQDRGSPRGQSAPVRIGLPCVIAAGGELSGSPHHPIRWGSASPLFRHRCRRSCRRRCRYIWDTSVE